MRTGLGAEEGWRHGASGRSGWNGWGGTELREEGDGGPLGRCEALRVRAGGCLTRPGCRWDSASPARRSTGALERRRAGLLGAMAGGRGSPMAKGGRRVADEGGHGELLLASGLRMGRGEGGPRGLADG